MSGGLKSVLSLVVARLRSARAAPPSDYRDGGVAELEEIEEFVRDLLEWEGD